MFSLLPEESEISDIDIALKKISSYSE